MKKKKMMMMMKKKKKKKGEKRPNFDALHRLCLLPPMISGSLSPRHGASSGCGWKTRPPEMNNEQLTRVVAPKLLTVNTKHVTI